MPFLEIVHMTGDSDRRELTKQQPVTIGSHASNDIQIDEDGVEIMHCRISWGKKGYEAVAAGTEGLDHNGTHVNSVSLKAGDTLRFGTVDVRYVDGADDVEEVVDDIEMGLAPISGEVPIWEQDDSKPSKPSKPPAKKATRKKRPEPVIEDIEELEEIEEIEELEEVDELEEIDDGPADIMGGLDALADESLADVKLPSIKKPKSSKRRSEKVDELDEIDELEEVDDLEEIDELEEVDDSRGKTQDQESEEEITDGMSDRVRRAMRHSQVRPGEEDPFKSPLVLGLAGTAVALLLTGAIFYFIANRQTIQDKFDAAKGYYDEGNYIQAIEKFQEFELVHPQHDLAKESKRLRGLSGVRQMTEGAVPKFPEGLERLRGFISDQRDLEDFDTQHPTIMDQAKLISVGAAKMAGKQFEPKLLDTSSEARTILTTYAPKDTPPTETLNEIESSLRISEAAILEKGVYDDHIAQIEAALKGNKPLVALKKRQDLLVRYPNFEGNRTVKAKLAEALQAEQSSVSEVAGDATATTEDLESPADLLTLAFRGRTRTDEVSVGNSVIAMAKDCCYGIDFVTGTPIWRRVIGFDAPFFPLHEPNLPSVIVFDSNRLELVRVQQADGKLVWRLPVGEHVTGEPLLVDGTVYAPTESGRLLAVDLQSGNLASSLQFSQPIGAPVELKDGRLVIAGLEEVVYVVTKRPFACESVSYFGQQPRSIEAPLLAMGSYLLAIENKADNANVHLVETDTPDKTLKIIATERVEGNVLDAPVIRGRDLFIPSSGERVSAFSVSDDPGQPPLTAGPTYQGEGETQSSIHLLTGPDRQLWMAMGRLDRLQLTTDSLQPDGEPVSQGTATQPLMYTSGYLLNARKRAYTDAVTFTRTNRDNLESDWQAVLGGKPLAWTFRDAGGLNLAVVNESGHAFRIGEKQLAEGNFLNDATRLPLHPDLVTPLYAAEAPGSRIAACCGGPEPRLWLINAAGQIEGSPTLPDAPQASPAVIGNRVVVPLLGRVHVVRTSGQSAAQDFALPTGEDHPWLNLVSAGENSGVGITKDGLVLLLRLQTSPRLFLDEVARVDLGAQVVHPAHAANDLIAVADTTNTVSVLTSDRLDLRGKRQFGGGVTAPPVIVSAMLFVEEGQSELHAMTPTGELASQWSFALNGASIAGLTQVSSGLLLAQQNGVVSLMNPATGEVLKQTNFQMPIATAPFVAGTETFVATVDGTLIRLTKMLTE